MQFVRDLGVQNTSDGRMAIFAVPVTEGEVFLAAKSIPMYDETRSIVYVDSRKLVRLWRNDPSGIARELACGTETTWRADSKFSKAESGFSHGFNNPVPLANIFCESVRPPGHRTTMQRLLGLPASMFVGFTNGITRTIWLMANGCVAFPVECETDKALELCRLAGVAGTEPRRLIGFFPMLGLASKPPNVSTDRFAVI